MTLVVVAKQTWFMTAFYVLVWFWLLGHTTTSTVYRTTLRNVQKTAFPFSPG